MELFRSSTIEVDRDNDGTVFLKIDVPGRSVNVITQQVLTDLDAALERLSGERTLPLLVVRSGKTSGFLAGADLSEFLGIEDSAGAEAMSARGQQLFDRLSRLPLPSIAMIHGPCLGGGLELALACDYRLVYDRPGTQLGLPEVELGLLPAWGGPSGCPVPLAWSVACR